MATTENVKKLIQRRKDTKAKKADAPEVSDVHTAEAKMAAGLAERAAEGGPMPLAPESKTAEKAPADATHEDLVAFARATPGCKVSDIIRHFKVGLNRARAAHAEAAHAAVTPATQAAAETFLDSQGAADPAPAATPAGDPLAEAAAAEPVAAPAAMKVPDGMVLAASPGGGAGPFLDEGDRRYWPAKDGRTILLLPLASIHEHPANPRLLYPRIEELGADIKEHGLREPIKVRGVEGGFEVLSGHRRLRAMKAIGWTETLAVVEQMDDLAAYQRVVVENEHREDLTAVEEGIAFQGLISRGQTVEQIAALVGKSVAHAYARMKLVALGDAGRQAMIDGWLSAETALLVARIPTAALQEQALKEIGPDKKQGHDAMSYREAQEHIQGRYMLVLSKASFDRKSLDLLPAAGACSECPKRSGALPAEIRTDLKGADICLDRDCYRAKVEADWTLRKAAAAEAQIEVIDAAAADKRHLVYTGDQVAEHEGFCTLESTCHNDKEYRAWKNVLPKAAVPAPDILIQSPHTGAAIPAWKRETLVKAAVEAKALKASDVHGDSGRSTGTDEKEAAARKKIREERKVAHAAIEQILTKPPKMSTWPVELMREIGAQMLDQGWASRMAKRRGLEDGAAGLYDALKKMDAGEVLVLILEAALQRQVESMLAPYGDRSTRAFRANIAALGVEWKEAEQIAAGGEEEDEDPEAKKAGAKGPLARKKAAKK